MVKKRLLFLGLVILLVTPIFVISELDVSIQPPIIKFNEGTNEGKFTATITNKGYSTFGMSLYIKDCTDGFSSSVSSTGLVLNPGQTGTKSFLIVGSSISEDLIIEGTCKLIIKDSLSGDEISTTIPIQMTQMQACTPNEMVCSKDYNTNKESVLKCNSQGTRYDIVQNCLNEEICRSGECVQIKKSKNNFFVWIFLAILLIIVLIYLRNSYKKK